MIRVNPIATVCSIVFKIFTFIFIFRLLFPSSYKKSTTLESQ